MSGTKGLADHHPIEEHPQSGQPNLYRGFGLSLQLQLDEGGDVDRFDLGEIAARELDPSLIRFELLLGIRGDQLVKLKEAGMRTQVYVTYGSEWFLYLCNRLAEHPPSLLPVFAKALNSAEAC